MDEAREVVAQFCERNPYLLGALPMTWFGCGPFARMVVSGVIYELRCVVVRTLAIADSKDAKPYVEALMDTWRLWPVRVVLWLLTVGLLLMPFLIAAELAVEKFVATTVHNIEIVLALTTAVKLPRRWSWTLKAMAVALRGTLHTVTASAPMVAWGAIFFATMEPFKLVSSETNANVRKLLLSPVHILLNLIRGKPLLGEKKPPAPDVAATKVQSTFRGNLTRRAAAAPAPAAPAPAPAPAPPKRRLFGLLPPKKTIVQTEITKPAPEGVVYALLAGWFCLAVYLNSDFARQVGQTLTAEAVKEAAYAEARIKMGL